MSDPFFFGYGSLVNRATHAHAEAYPAVAHGWRRAWRRTPLRPVAFLTAVRCEASAIEGLLAAVPGADWAALDEREAAYARVPLAKVTHALDRPLEAAIYAIPEERHEAPTPASPILLSYLDVVVQGHLREFGETGVSRFAETTGGWDAPVLNDRAAPRYPRSLTLDASETAVVDRLLARLGVTLIPTVTASGGPASAS